MAKLERRRIGETKLELTTLGIGCAVLGGLFGEVTRKEAMALLGAGLDAGLRYIDTAPFYGYGQSERRVGDSLRALPRDEFVLSTKAGRLLRPRTKPQAADDGWVKPLPFEVVHDYGYDGVMRSFEDSLQRLGQDRIDILLLHDIGAFTHGAAAHPKLMKDAMEGGHKALVELRDSGTISAIGMGVNEIAVCQEALRYGDWDCFLLAGRYTLLEQNALDELLPKCERRGTSIICGGAFNSGILAGGDTWDYAKAPAEILDKAKRLNAVCRSHNVPLPAAALQFPLGHKQIKTVLPGAGSEKQMRENLANFLMDIPASLWSDLRAEGLLHPDAPTPV